MEHDSHSLETIAVHGGQSPDPLTGAVMQPVYQTSTYAQDGIGQPRAGYEYARVQNPTREALERNIAALEGGSHGSAFASGLAAIEAIVKRLSAGDHVVSEENVYGGTMRMFQQVLARLGIAFTFVDTRDPEAVRAAIRDETRLIHIETPTNPMMRVADIRAIAAIARDAGVPLCVDNTFATPINQRPLELGAQVVVHSATKYLNGHSDVIGGVVATSDEGWAEHLAFMQKATGPILGPWDSWLVLRGTKTLYLRMAAHNRNGLEVARFLAARDDLKGVFYPGLPSDPSHEVAKSQMCGFTGMVSFEVEDLERAQRIATSTRVFTLAESLGGVESLVNHPAIMTHASVPEEARRRMGVSDGLLRLSVGIEGIDDLLADLEQALDA
ncbi:MAG TPA: PLP-dependent aspartate aminotransferase family protein [Longimicrobiales bacterium]|nr:PLP-dependent aspartate aminotransferase family protein [Longimicrobiales bacterium]